MSALRMKTAVIFDVGGVLIRAPQLAIAAYEEELHLPKGLIVQAMVKGTPDNAFSRLEIGQLTLSQFVPVFEQELCTLAKDRDMQLSSGFSALELFKRIKEGYSPCAEMFTAVAKIKQSGLKTCVVTNNWIDDLLTPSIALPSSNLFDCILESCKLGIRKPNPQIYLMACEQLRVQPNEVVFLDDLGTNLKSARSLGITTIKVTDPLLALRELEYMLGLTLTNSHL